MFEKSNWINHKDIGYLINDNHVDGPFMYHVIYPERKDCLGYFCLYNKPMTKEETMVDILPAWNDSLEAEKIGYGSPNFQELYNSMYSEIDGIFYRNIYIYDDILLYENKTSYKEYKARYCKDKESANELWNFLKNKATRSINLRFQTNATHT